MEQLDLTDISQIWQPFRKDTTKYRDVLNFHDDYLELLENTETLAYLIRSLSVYEMTCAALGHPGGSFSEAEILAALFNYTLRFDSKNPGWDMRDVFYLSKCHACPGLYATLSLFGYFPVTDLKEYGSWGSHLESHPDCLKTPGIEISGGSLGQIAGVAVGRGLAIRRKGPDHSDRMVYVLVGDGECNEGSVWEAFMAAGHYNLDNVVFLIDYNKLQAKGFLHQDMNIEPLADKLTAFNLNPYTVENGHDVSEIIDVFTHIRVQRCGKPLAIIFNTMKGNKVRMCQYNPNWHTSAPRRIEMAREWLEEIWETDGRRLGVPHEWCQSLGKMIEIVPPQHENPEQIAEKQA